MPGHPQPTLPRLRRWFGDPRFLLALIAGLLAFAIQSGELGTADTMHRLQTAHAIWTGEPQVFPQEYPEFGIHGRGGELESWYGIGQSLLMLPADVAGAFLERLRIFAKYNGNDPSVRDIVVSYTTNILVSALTALVCFRLLTQLGFRCREAIAGVLALFFATTHLHYTQNMMENNYIFLLTLTGFSYQYEWLECGCPRALLIGSAAFGLNLLTRLTTGIDLLAGGFFLLLVLLLRRTPAAAVRTRFLAYLRIALPVYALFVALDRWYQDYRFGSFFNTYLSIFAREARQRDPSLPSNYPWETPFHAGFFGALFQPEKSIFLFDPLLIVLLLLVVFSWRRFSIPAKAYTIATTALLFGYISFYARYTVWSGDFAWGDRYVSTAVDLAVLLAIPLLMRHRVEIGKGLWAAGLALLSVSIVIQLASLAFWLPLEIYQMETLGHPTFVIALRMRNIAAFALGKMDAWGLNNHAMTEDPWDYVHITTWNVLPFLLRRVGAAPTWVVRVAFAVWFASLAALAAALWRLRGLFAQCDESSAPPN
ncbi:MAG TPA: hypothetical protein VHX11_04090 [Acidobacteriaceae bacterium]|jgi:hypothetical protein|nr:hypothetical protein [Acidobacteriaceae bacterium]